MKKIDKLKKQRYDLSMKILELEFKEKRAKLNKNEQSELKILLEKFEDVEQRIKEINE